MESVTGLATARCFEVYILMFGLSRDERRRLENAEAAANHAVEIGNKALLTIAEHLAACVPLQAGVSRRLDNIEDQNKWQSRYLIATLVSIIIGIVAGIAAHKGLF